MPWPTPMHMLTSAVLRAAAAQLVERWWRRSARPTRRAGARARSPRRSRSAGRPRRRGPTRAAPRGLRGERLVDLDQVDVGERPPGPCERLRGAGTGPMPMIRGGTPATATDRTRASGASPWASRVVRRGRGAAPPAPSFSVLELPRSRSPRARTRAAARASPSGEESARGPRRPRPYGLPAPGHVDRDRARRRSGRRRSPRPPWRGCGARTRPARPADPVLGREVLGRLPERAGVAQRLHPRVDEPPPERGVVTSRRAGRIRARRLRDHERRAAHRLHAAGHVRGRPPPARSRARRRRPRPSRSRTGG